MTPPEHTIAADLADPTGRRRVVTTTDEVLGPAADETPQARHDQLDRHAHKAEEAIPWRA